MAYSAGFSPHPKISYVGAAPTGVASEAEYLEIGLAKLVDPDQLCRELDDVLPAGLDIDEAVPAGPGSLAERMQASVWRIELPGVDEASARAALDTFLAREEVAVERLTKSGRRSVNTREPVLAAAVTSAGVDDPSGVVDGAITVPRAILTLVVRQVTPTVRPDDLVAALRDVAGLAPAGPPIAVRLAQGPLDDNGEVGDPLAVDRFAATQTS